MITTAKLNIQEDDATNPVFSPSTARTVLLPVAPQDYGTTTSVTAVSKAKETGSTLPLSSAQLYARFMGTIAVALLLLGLWLTFITSLPIVSETFAIMTGLGAAGTAIIASLISVLTMPSQEEIEQNKNIHIRISIVDNALGILTGIIVAAAAILPAALNSQNVFANTGYQLAMSFSLFPGAIAVRYGSAILRRETAPAPQKMDSPSPA